MVEFVSLITSTLLKCSHVYSSHYRRHEVSVDRADRPQILGIPVIYEAAIIDNVVKLQFARANTHHQSIRVGEYDRYRLW